jgi:hypothetical protein
MPREGTIMNRNLSTAEEWTTGIILADRGNISILECATLAGLGEAVIQATEEFLTIENTEHRHRSIAVRAEAFSTQPAASDSLGILYRMLMNDAHRDQWSFYYARAMISHLQGDQESAKYDLKAALALSVDSSARIKILLLNLELLLSEGPDVPILAPLFAEIDSLRPRATSTELMRLRLCLARRYLLDQAGVILAYKYLSQVILTAVTLKLWPIAYIGSVLLANNKEQSSNQDLSLNLENQDLAIRRSIYSTVATRTKKLELDCKYYSMCYGTQTQSLANAPRIFKFIHACDQSSGISRADLARILWPKDGYLPRTHDPRIFDLAKRARMAVASVSKNSLELKCIDGRYFIDAVQGVLAAEQTLVTEPDHGAEHPLKQSQEHPSHPVVVPPFLC